MTAQTHRREIAGLGEVVFNGLTSAAHRKAANAVAKGDDPRLQGLGYAFEVLIRGVRHPRPTHDWLLGLSVPNLYTIAFAIAEVSTEEVGWRLIDGLTRWVDEQQVPDLGALAADLQLRGVWLPEGAT